MGAVAFFVESHAGYRAEHLEPVCSDDGLRSSSELQLHEVKVLEECEDLP